MSMATITRKGRRFVLVPVEEYEQLIDEVLPPLPPADADGTSN